ncbi:MAG TPA: thiamine phosphate synthase [Nitrospiria bacterium]|jgi:thiamine-phosphate pyrophosphorylase|nr:thiamine phosphate synthase [Nitrospiria bacterium]
MKSSVASGLTLILDHDSLAGRSLTDVAAQAMAGGVESLQYRAKNLSKRDAYYHALQLRALSRRSGVTFLINDWVDLALAVGADGVHLGQDDLPLSAARSLLGPDRIIGISAHVLEQATEAEAGGADYLGIGPVFSSITKQDRPPLGCEMLRRFREQVRIPIVAIGGISPRNVRQVMTTGVDGVAVVSAILSQSDVKRATADLEKILRSG